MRQCVILAIAIFFFLDLKAQVNGVMYQLQYNESTKKYTLLLNITSGETVSLKDKVQCNAQVGLTAPANSKVEIIESFHPTCQNNTKAIWSVTSFLNAPSISEKNSYMGISPNLSPTGFYPNLKAGDVLPLFSFKVSPQPSDFNDIRLYDNSIDPDKDKAGMNGGDFNNGFSMGGPWQLYDGIIPLTLNTSALAEKE
jgi:hypothetical protein